MVSHIVIQISSIRLPISSINSAFSVASLSRLSSNHDLILIITWLSFLLASSHFQPQLFTQHYRHIQQDVYHLTTQCGRCHLRLCHRSGSILNFLISKRSKNEQNNNNNTICLEHIFKIGITKFAMTLSTFFNYKK